MITWKHAGIFFTNNKDIHSLNFRQAEIFLLDKWFDLGE